MFVWPSKRAIAAIGVTAVLVPLECLVWRDGLTTPVIHFTRIERTAEEIVGCMLVAVLAAAFVVGIVLAAIVRPHMRRLENVLVVMAMLSVVAAGYVAVRGVRALDRPAPYAFGELLDETTPLDLGATLHLGDATIAYESNCTLHIFEPESSQSITVDRPGEPCTPLRVVRSSRGDFAFVLVRDHALDLQAPVWPVASFGTSRRAGDLRPIDFGGRLGASREAVVGAIMGALLGALAVLAALRTRRSAKLLDAATEGVHAGRGWLMVGGSTLHMRELSYAAPGVVAVIPTPSDANAIYRDEGVVAARLVGCGPRSALRRASTTRTVCWAGAAIAAACIFAAPLCVECFMGFC
jgi:hypothetical protein